jgi:hypothetical protein
MPSRYFRKPVNQSSCSTFMGPVQAAATLEFAGDFSGTGCVRVIGSFTRGNETLVLDTIL